MTRIERKKGNVETYDHCREEPNENRDHRVCVTHIKKLELHPKSTKLLKRFEIWRMKRSRLYLKISGCSLCVNYESEFGSEKAD